MPTDIIEHFESLEISRSFDESVLEIKAIYVRDEDTYAVEVAFMAWLLTQTSTAGGFLRSTRVAHVGGGVHECYATYYAPTNTEIVKVVRYRTTGASARVLQGFGSVYSVQANPDFDPGNPIGPSNQPNMPGPNFRGLVGVTSDGVEGVDVPTPAFAFSIDYKFSTVSQSYLYLVHQLTGCVNSVPYLGYAPGELLFTGVEGEVGLTSGGAIVLSGSPISYNFEASPNLTGIVVGPFTIPFKYGWDYLWPRTVEDTDDVAISPIRKTKSVHIDRVLRWADLSLLAI